MREGVEAVREGVEAVREGVEAVREGVEAVREGGGRMRLGMGRCRQKFARATTFEIRIPTRTGTFRESNTISAWNVSALVEESGPRLRRSQTSRPSDEIALE